MVDLSDGLEPLSSVLVRDERWRGFGNRTLNQHHAMIERYALHDGVPADVLQHYENARNTWLSAFFNYRLLQVALMQVHVAGEAAVKARAKLEGVDTEKTALKALLDMALKRRWLLDVNFEVTAERAEREAEHLEMLRFMGIARESLAGPLPEQDFAKGLVEAFRHIRNALVHGGLLLKPNLSWEFMAVRDLVNKQIRVTEL